MKQNIYRVPVPMNAKWYNSVYLTSHYWRWFRRQYLEGLGHRCEIANCTRRATEVHHLSYDYLFCEKREFVIALCQDCHAWMHKWPANDNAEQFALALERPKQAL
jgi:hypothetical protein